MLARVNAATATAIDRCARASLVFDLAVIEANMRRVATAARAARITPLFACKSFPHPSVRALAAELLDGFDVASLGELSELPRAKLLSIADPSGEAIARAPVGGRVIVGVETLIFRRGALVAWLDSSLCKATSTRKG